MYDVITVGAGIIGLAIARRFAMRGELGLLALGVSRIFSPVCTVCSALLFDARFGVNFVL